MSITSTQIDAVPSQPGTVLEARLVGTARDALEYCRRYPAQRLEAIMKRLYRLFAAVSLGLTVACAPAGSSSDTARSAEDRAAIDRGHEAFLAAMRANDVGALLPLVADDAVFTPPNTTIVPGKEAFRAWYEQLLTEMRTSAVTVSDRDVVVAGDWAIEHGQFDWTVTPVQGGDPIRDRGNFVAIWHREADGTWRIARDIWNSSEPLTGNPAAP